MMKETITLDLADFPSKIQPFLKNTQIFDSSSHSGAQVFYLDKGFYLKVAPKGCLAQEAELGQWFWEKGLGVELVTYLTEDRDYLVTKAADGQDATHFLANPRKLCQVLASILTHLHAMTPDDFPRENRLADYKDLVALNYQTGAFHESALLPRFGLKTRQEAYDYVQAYKDTLTEDCLIHGDFCLPNIILKKDYQFDVLIDFDSAGWGDRHIDLFWAIWSLNYNLGTDAYGDYFLDCYGRDKVDLERLKLIAAFEAFG
ncbi:aminoglycoside 3'-phosphotransferase [Streptococcus rifensis]